MIIILNNNVCNNIFIYISIGVNKLLRISTHSYVHTLIDHITEKMN